MIAFLINFDICCTMHVTLMKPRSLLSSSIPFHCQCHHHHLNNSIKNKPTTSKKSYRHRRNRWFRSGTLKVEIENHPSSRRLQFSYFFFCSFSLFTTSNFFPLFFLVRNGRKWHIRWMLSPVQCIMQIVLLPRCFVYWHTTQNRNW